MLLVKEIDSREKFKKGLLTVIGGIAIGVGVSYGLNLSKQGKEIFGNIAPTVTPSPTSQVEANK